MLALALALACTSVAPPVPLTTTSTLPVAIHMDGRDRWSLLDKKLVNRELFTQLAADRTRLGRNLGDRFTAAVDFAVGNQVSPSASESKTRFHGYFLVDTYLALRVIDGVEANLNLAIFNYSASEGYRFSSEIEPGGALHARFDLGVLDGDPLVFDFLAVDLDLVTLGEGLLLSETALEGEALSLRWKGIELRQVFGGKVFWNDNLLSFSLSILDAQLGVLVTTWFSDRAVGNLPELYQRFENRTEADYVSNYLNLYGHYDLNPHLGISGEYSARLGEDRWRSALLLRADWSDTIVENVRAHFGYQFRVYERGYGPRRAAELPGTAPLLPYREQIYATNSFEYFGASEYYHQWSHTVVAEARARFAHYFGITASAEYWARFSSDPSAHPRVLYLPGAGRMPGVSTHLYYRAGLELYPWSDKPHHGSALITNKLIDPAGAYDRSAVLFVDPTLFLFVAEVYL